ncbi:hypothetical protein NDU88_004111 [Pleurodeles waltl]|uniref:Uncharacterized protein n=1 Tax=Pleurodeles waltl TaxID=8319 RepID=A0AAV7TSJ8_PLEWA|nr:hypothetical protein NDU88_004111 [Pleurodeles waltl]
MLRVAVAWQRSLSALASCRVVLFPKRAQGEAHLSGLQGLPLHTTRQPGRTHWRTLLPTAGTPHLPRRRRPPPPDQTLLNQRTLPGCSATLPHQPLALVGRGTLDLNIADLVKRSVNAGVRPASSTSYVLAGRILIASFQG